MRCDMCNTKQATTSVHVHFNGQSKTMNLCTNCFNQVRSQYASHIPSSGSFGGFGSLEDFLNGMGSISDASSHVNSGAQSNREQSGMLEQFGRNLSDLARTGRIDPVIGRDQEISRVIEILNRRNKNNPVLIGEPGVGKTAIAEGLAMRIFTGDVPIKLRNKQVYNLDVSALVADTGIRGQFEERMNGIISELQARDDVILFIDEIHLLVGAGSAQGSMDAGNILKPALARGDLQVVGATTLKEYRQIEKDAALERRFQPVMVNEPSVDEAISILAGLQSKYEAFHHVKYTPAAIDACVKLSHRYIADRFLPDKAIDLLDEAGSKANLQIETLSKEDLENDLRKIREEKLEATKREAYERAAELHKEEQRLEKQLAEANDTAQEDKYVVDVDAIQSIVEEKTGIPVRKIQASEQGRLQNLAQELNLHVIGQAQAVEQVARAVKRSRMGIRRGTRPIGAFLFVGPTGVGKTELARSLALTLFGDKNAMIRLDMSEYMEKHSVSKLIGSPPGYVGYDEAGQLTERVRRNPYSLILLDEIEKAHPDVQNMFLQIMEDGRLTDSQGRTVSFKDTIIIMTSNAGVTTHKSSVGFQFDESSHEKHGQLKVELDALSGYFKPEFLNRFDAVIEFKSLGVEDLKQIADLLLEDLKRVLASQDVTLHWTNRAAIELGKRGYHPQYGARPLARVIQNEVEDRIADLFVEEGSHSQVMVDVDSEGQVVIQLS